MPKIIGAARKTINSDHSPLELASVILHQLYYKEPREKYFRNKKSGFTNFLLSPGSPEDTQLQKHLDTLLGGVPTAHLYIPQWEAEKPTHYISLSKDPDTNLWKLRHPKIRAVTSRMAYGVIVAWKALTPVPEVALDITPTFSLLVRGNSAFDNLAATLTSPTPDDYILIEETRQCTLLARMFGQATNGRIALWVPGNKPRVAGARVSVAFTPPANFDSPRVRKTVPYPTDRYHIRTTDTPLEPLCPATFSILPVIPDYEPEEFLSAEHNLLDKILKSRLLPFVGYQKANSKVDIYALNYFPKEKAAYPVKIFEDRLQRNCEGIPFFCAWNKYPGVWIPNLILTTYIKEHLQKPERRWFFDNALQTMPYFGAVHIENYNSKVFARYGIELSQEEIDNILAADNEPK